MDEKKYLKGRLLDAMTGIKEVVKLLQEGETETQSLNLEQNEKKLIRKAMAMYHTQKRVAQELGISRATLRRKCAKYNIKIER